MDGTYLNVRVRESTFETELARAKLVLSDKLTLIRKEYDLARAGAAAGNAAIQPAPQPQPSPEPKPEPQPRPVPSYEVVAGAGADKTFWEACDGYLDNRGPAKDAWRKQVEAIRDFVGPEVRCRHAGVNRFVTSVVAALGKPGSADGTIKRQIVSPIRAVLTWAASEWGADQGCFVPKFRRMAGDRINKTVLVPQMAEKVIEKALQKGYACLAAVIAVGLCEGPRRSELFNLALEDVDLATARMVFRDVKDRGKGKLRSKVKRNRTVLRAHRRTVEALVGYIALTGRTKGRVFVRDSGAPFPSVEVFGDEMNAQLEELTSELPDHYTLHVLRHSFASYEFAVRPNPVWVQERGDWETLSSAMRYVHLLGEDLRDAVLAFWHETPTHPLAQT